MTSLTSSALQHLCCSYFISVRTTSRSSSSSRGPATPLLQLFHSGEPSMLATKGATLYTCNTFVAAISFRFAGPLDLDEQRHRSLQHFCCSYFILVFRPRCRAPQQGFPATLLLQLFHFSARIAGAFFFLPTACNASVAAISFRCRP